jgi:integrase
VNLFRAGQGRPLVSVEADMSVTMRVLAPAVTGEQRCHFLVHWRDSHAIQHGRTFTTWSEAAEFDAAIKAGRLPRDAPGCRAAVTFGAAAQWWLATKQATKRPSTAELYATELRCHVLPAFAEMPLADITRREVQHWINTLASSALSAATVRHIYRAVFKSVLTDAIDDGLLARSPCHRIELPAATMPAIEPLTPAQVLTLADRIDSRYEAMVWLGAGCGLRWSEAAALTRDRIHLGARAQVTIDRQLGYRPATTRHSAEAASRPLFAPPKTAASCRVVPVPATVTAALRVHLRAYPPGPDGLLFTTPQGNVLNPANWRQRIWRPWSGPHPAFQQAPPSTGSGMPMPRCWAMPACPITRFSGGSATPILARSAGTATPTPTRATARPPATRSTPPSPQPRPAASRQQRVDFVDGKVDQPPALAANSMHVSAGHKGTNGCAARDLNPEPAVKSPLYPGLRGIRLYRRLSCDAGLCTSPRFAVPGCAGHWRPVPGHTSKHRANTSAHNFGPAPRETPQLSGT